MILYWTKNVIDKTHIEHVATKKYTYLGNDVGDNVRIVVLVKILFHLYVSPAIFLYFKTLVNRSSFSYLIRFIFLVRLVLWLVTYAEKLLSQN